MEHEPCASRGECYHSRGARNQPREAKVSNARKTNATWGKTPEARKARARGARNQPREAKVYGGRISARKMNETWGKTPEAREARAHAGRIGGHKMQETWGKTPEAQEARACGAHIGGRISAERHARLKPNMGEAAVAALFMTLHPDIWADIIWQRHLPQNLRGVPDLRHPIGVVGEYDGGGHHMKEDRSTDDTVKDIERRAAGFTVIRETDPYILVAKFAYAVRGRFR